MPPRALAERGLNIERWAVMPKGGRFAAIEQPSCLRRICESSSVHCDRSKPLTKCLERDASAENQAFGSKSKAH